MAKLLLATATILGSLSVLPALAAPIVGQDGASSDLGCMWCVSAPPVASAPSFDGIAQLAGAVPLRDLSAEMAAAPLTVSVADDAHRPAIPVPQPDRTLVYLFGSLALGATVRLAPLAFRPRPESLLTPKRGA